MPERNTHREEKSMLAVEVKKVISAAPAVVYDVIADYRVGHNAIVPRPYFTDLEVIEGGYGAGTIIKFSITVFGQTDYYHQRVTEPEKGRIIEESSIDREQATRFILDPCDDGRKTDLTIHMEIPIASGITGFFERLITVPVVRWLFNKELNNLDAYVTEKNAREQAMTA